ncbi:hypothetical protein QE152_g5638 [Popillia japonica]|uniref:Uncharacterized protein n=1 Tax=Popillia japonica TaxID=7064 RepID=A0AAW1MH24_POPJA
MSGEKVSANESEIQEFIGKLDAKIIELGLDPKQIYNADETGKEKELGITETKSKRDDEVEMEGENMDKHTKRAIIVAYGSNVDEVAEKKDNFRDLMSETIENDRGIDRRLKRNSS